MTGPWKLVLGALAPLFGCCGCAVNNADMLHFLREHKNEVSAIEYRIGIPDTIAISAPRILEIDGDGQRLQPDGKINLRLLGEVKVVGLTAKEIAAKLEVLLSRYYVDPRVSVRVVDYASKKYYVHGEVGRAGSRPYTGRDTLLDAVLASGVSFQSWTSRTQVIRPAHGETPVRTIQVDIARMLASGDWSENILLEPNDIVHVPPTPGAWIAHRVAEVLYPVGPAIQAYVTPAYLGAANNVYRNNNNQTGFGFGGGLTSGSLPRP